MPKIRDLGINVLPETMRPPEIGEGAGGGAVCGNLLTVCTFCTNGNTFDAAAMQPTPCIGWSFCIGGTRNAMEAAPCHAPSVCICTAASPCVGGTLGCGCTNPPTYCICTAVSPCVGGTHGCGCTNPPTYCICTAPTPCGHSVCACTNHHTVCACSAVASICTGGSHITITIVTTTPQYAAAGVLTKEHVSTLRDELQQQLSILEELEKNLGPRTAEAIDAREAELKKELEDLANRRRNLDKK
jgi:hypothetical protein